MSTEVTVALITAIVGATTVAANIMVGRWKAQSEDRKASGTVSTTEASELWAQTRTLIDEYKQSRQDEREMREKLEARLEATNKKLFEVMTELSKVQKSNSKLEFSNIDLMKKMDDLKEIIAKLTRENEQLLRLKKVEGDDGSA